MTRQASPVAPYISILICLLICTFALASCSTHDASSPAARAVTPIVLKAGDYSTTARMQLEGTTDVNLGDGAVLSIPHGSAPVGATIIVTSSAPPQHWSPAQAPLRSPVHLSLSTGELTGPAILEFPMGPTLSAPEYVTAQDRFGVSTWDALSRSWSDMPVATNPVSRTIIVHIYHFSWWEPWTWDWVNLGAELSQDILQTLGKRSAAPSCRGGIPAYIAYVNTESAASDPLRSCAETRNGVLEVQMSSNRSYSMVMRYGAPVSWGWHDPSGSPAQEVISVLIDKHLPRNSLYIPPLAAASVGVPNTKFGFAVFEAAPTSATVFADVAQLVFGNLPGPAVGTLLTKALAKCGQLLGFSQINLSLGAAESLVMSIGGCLGAVVQEAASLGGLDALSVTDLERVAGTCAVLARLVDVGIGINLGAEVGDLVLGRFVDQGLREFSVMHASATPSTGTTSSTTLPTTSSTVSLSPGQHFDSDCAVAWPTAPAVSTAYIQMTMSCSGVPESEYLFTIVQYADPNLPVTPDTGSMKVIGAVVGSIRSDYGYSELEVQASNVILP
jgi:hypothetical protein